MASATEDADISSIQPRLKEFPFSIILQAVRHVPVCICNTVIITDDCIALNTQLIPLKHGNVLSSLGAYSV